METTQQPRRQCEICNAWSRELVPVASDLGKNWLYYVHSHEVAQMKALVKIARAERKAEKAANIAKYGQRYHH